MLNARDYFGDQKWLTDAVIIGLQHCLLLNLPPSGTEVRFDAQACVDHVRRYRPTMTVIDGTDPRKRVPADRLGDCTLASMINLEIRSSIENRAQIRQPRLPRRVWVTNVPSLDVAPNPLAVLSPSTNPLDAPSDALGLKGASMSSIDLASLMKDPKKLGEFLASAVHTMSEVPKMRAQLDDAKQKVDTVESALKASEQVSADRQLKIDDLDTRLKSALTRASAGAVSTPNPAGTGNDLKALAAAMHVTEQQLKNELESFVQTCGLPLPNAVRWPAWCDPSDKASPLPFCYRHHKPVFLAGESGTGKTFIAEALCMLEAGRRCAVTFHEKISYNKLFVRETVDGGKVRSVLGPILLSMLTGTPIVLDEIDHADVFVQSLMHEVLDKRRVFIPELALCIVAEKGCEFIATGNSLTDDSGQYHGDVGTALRTRFAAIHVEYPEKSVEADTVKTASNCSGAFSLTIASVFAALRAAVQEQKIAGPISVRESCAVGTLFMQGKTDNLADDVALGLALGIMVVQKRPPQEQIIAAEICATVAKVAVGNFQAKVASAGQAARAGKGAKP